MYIFSYLTNLDQIKWVASLGIWKKLLKVSGQIGLHQLRTISVKSLVSLNACVYVIFLPANS